MRLYHQVAIVTGAGRGIGRAAALALAREGAHVMLVSRTFEELCRVRDEIGALFGRQSLAMVGDVSKPADVRRIVNATLEAWGRIDFLINNAGVVSRRLLIDTPIAEWDRVMAVNLRGPFLLCKAVLPTMMKQRGGYIINISSGAGKHGPPYRAAYAASKFGLVGMTQSLWQEVRDYNVRVHVLCPGPVSTVMRAESFPDEIPETLIQPEDVANAILFLIFQPATAYVPEIIVSPGLRIAHKGEGGGARGSKGKYGGGAVCLCQPVSSEW